MTPDAAQAAGALALFGEKYGEEVRVVSMGADGDIHYSTELCGGTHARRTGDIGLFKIVSEGAVAAGVRRIEAVTRKGAIAYIAERDKALVDAASALRVAVADVPARVAALVEERRKLERELAEARRAAAVGNQGGGAAQAAQAFEEIAGIKFAGRLLGEVPARELKPIADELKGKLGSGVVTLLAEGEGKASVVIAVTADLAGRISAIDLVRVAVAELGGKGGGGRPDMAQGGGPNPAKAGDALAAVKAALGKSAQAA
jgi:alanyl-tRNA synthetase